MGKDKKAAAGVDNTARRTWNKDEFVDKAADREKKVKSWSTALLVHLCLTATPSSYPGCITKEKDTEESALDAKKRRRLGTSAVEVRYFQHITWFSRLPRSGCGACREGSLAPGPYRGTCPPEAARLHAGPHLACRQDASRDQQHASEPTGEFSARMFLQLRSITLYTPRLRLRRDSCVQAGYYCSVCECILRDSQSYLDHINGKYHNRALGMSMRVERSTAEDVRFDLEHC